MTTMNKAERKKTVTKIRKFLEQKDDAAIDTGVLVATSAGHSGGSS